MIGLPGVPSNPGKTSKTRGLCTSPAGEPLRPLVTAGSGFPGRLAGRSLRASWQSCSAPEKPRADFPPTSPGRKPGDFPPRSPGRKPGDFPPQAPGGSPGTLVRWAIPPWMARWSLWHVASPSFRWGLWGGREPGDFPPQAPGGSPGTFPHKPRAEARGLSPTSPGRTPGDSGPLGDPAVDGSLAVVARRVPQLPLGALGWAEARA
jgi:hypothetical protein